MAGRATRLLEHDVDKTGQKSEAKYRLNRYMLAIRVTQKRHFDRRPPKNITIWSGSAVGGKGVSRVYAIDHHIH